jgi:ribosomal-protein-serine acetyltransferase
MTLVCRALVSEAFSRYALHRVEIRCATGNVKSAAIPQRLGFTEEGTLRQAEWLFDHWVDLRLFSMLAQDWKRE